MSIASRTMGIASICAVMMIAGGCGSYYKVTDPTTGRVYYTEHLDKRGSAVVLRDARTGQDVTIQNSEIQSIKKEQFETARVNSGSVPGESSARAAAEPAQPMQPQPPMQPAQPQQPVARTAPAPAPEAAPAAQASVAGATVGMAQAAFNSPAQLRDDLAAGQAQVDRTIAALTAVGDPDQADLRGAYKSYCTEMDKLGAHAQRLETEAEAMRQARSAYFARWDQRLSEIDNPTIRDAAEQRRARLRAAQDRISADAAAARDAYRPLMSDLKDIRKFLDGDLSKDTTSVLGPATMKATKDAQSLKERIDVVIADLDAVQGAVSPAGGSR